MLWSRIREWWNAPIISGGGQRWKSSLLACPVSKFRYRTLASIRLLARSRCAPSPAWLTQSEEFTACCDREVNSYFFELGLSPDISVRRWQKRTEPLFQWVFEGCYVTRNIPELITQGGFQLDKVETGYLARFPKTGSYYFWGVARPRT